MRLPWRRRKIRDPYRLKLGTNRISPTMIPPPQGPVRAVQRPDLSGFFVEDNIIKQNVI